MPNKLIFYLKCRLNFGILIQNLFQIWIWLQKKFVHNLSWNYFFSKFPNLFRIIIKIGKFTKLFNQNLNKIGNFKRNIPIGPNPAHRIACKWAAQPGSPPGVGLDWGKELGHGAGLRTRVLGHLPVALPERETDRAQAQERGREWLTCRTHPGFDFFTEIFDCTKFQQIWK
jgi:hypothetical protein